MRLASTRSLVVLTIAGIIAACSASGSDNGFDDDGKSSANGDPGGNGSGGGGIGGSFTVGTGSGGGSGDGCSEAAKLVYVLSDTNELYSFRPDQRQFTLIGELNCPTSLSPNSMAVDRDATAWVNYVDGLDTQGVLFRVSTVDASCESAPTVQLPQGWARMGMGFSLDVVGQTSETLYVTGTAPVGGGSSPGLGRIDLTTNTLFPIGEFSGALSGQNAELTGTGDGRLYGFFTTTPVQVAEINKTSGAILSATPLQGVETPNYWAFSFWGGDFYLYTASSSLETTDVARYRPSDGSVDPAYMTQIGFRIVGAGVSTCAPLTPPE